MSMRRVKITLLISILLISGVVIVSIWANLQGRKRAEEKEKPPEVTTEGADTRLEKIHLVEDKHGRKTWELEAKSIQQHQDQNMMVLEDIKVIYYTNDGRLFTITGQQGKVYQDSKDIELKGDVVVTSSDGYRMRTQSVAYRNKEKTASTEDAVELEGDQIQMTGNGMIVDMEGKWFRLLRGVRTHWRPGGKG